jgi:hypothetical protein
LDDVGDFVGKWWGAAAKDERGNMVDTSMEAAPVTEDMLRMGRRALLFFRLLPRFPHHRNRYKCTHRGLLMDDDEDARTFVAAFCAVCEWYGFVPDERPGTDEQGNEVPGLLREELRHEGVFRYLTSDDFPMPMRDNVEDVYLKSGHVRLFQQSMPEVSDFAQSRRELNGKPLSLAKDGPLSALNLQEDDVLAFADRPLSPLQLGAYVVCVDIGKLQAPDAQDDQQDNLLLPFRQEVKCMALDEFDRATPLLSKLPFGPEWKTDKMPRTNNANDMMQRLESDLQHSAHDMMQGYAANMRMLDSRVIANLRKQIEAARLDRDAISGVQAAQELSRAVSQLDELLAALGEQREKDAQRVMEGTGQLVELANASSVKSGGERELLQFQCVPRDHQLFSPRPCSASIPHADCSVFVVQASTDGRPKGKGAFRVHRSSHGLAHLWCRFAATEPNARRPGGNARATQGVRVDPSAHDTAVPGQPLHRHRSAAEARYQQISPTAAADAGRRHNSHAAF